MAPGPTMRRTRPDSSCLASPLSWGHWKARGSGSVQSQEVAPPSGRGCPPALLATPRRWPQSSGMGLEKGLQQTRGPFLAPPATAPAGLTWVGELLRVFNSPSGEGSGDPASANNQANSQSFSRTRRCDSAPQSRGHRGSHRLTHLAAGPLCPTLRSHPSRDRMILGAPLTWSSDSGHSPGLLGPQNTLAHQQRWQ